MIEWNETSIRLMRDFSEHTEFYPKLGAFLLPLLNTDGHVLDAGCGLGYLGRELIKGCRRVTGIENNPLAASKAKALQSGISGLEILAGDIFSLPPETPYDAVVCCYFGSVKQCLKLAGEQCAGRLIMVKRDTDSHRFSTAKIKLHKQPLMGAATELERLNIPFELHRITLEAGQPLKSLEDGKDFFALYNQSPDKGQLTDAEVEARLVKGSGSFPYYLPMERKMGVIIVNTKDINGGTK